MGSPGWDAALSEEPQVSLMDAVMNNTGFLTNIKQQYDYVFTDLRDPRVDDWFLMSSVWPNVGLCALYYYIIRIWGPRFMKDREPYNIQTLITAYNLFQTLFSLWIWYKATRFWLTGKYNWLCQPVDFSYTQDGFDVADMTWWYFFSKYVDFFNSSCGSSLHNAIYLMVWNSVCWWRPHHLLRVPQYGRTHHHVLLLLHVHHGTQRPEIPLVEKILDQAADGPVRDLLHSRLLSTLHRV